MARMQYVDTVTLAAPADGDLDALAGVQVNIYIRGTTTPAQVYTTEGGGTAFPNPYTTTASGLVAFWADFGKYDVRYADTNPSPRFAAWTIGWDSTPYDNLVGTVPTGIIVPTGLRRAPTGWLMCDGSEVSRTTYARLWDALRTDAAGALTSSSPYGNGNGSTTFNVPDARARTMVGPDGSAGRLTANDAVGNFGGEEKHTLLAAESGVNGSGTTGNDTPDHTHRQRSWSSLNANVDAGNQWALLNIFEYFQTDGASTRHTHPLTARNADLPHNNMQPYLVTNYMIKD